MKNQTIVTSPKTSHGGVFPISRNIPAFLALAFLVLGATSAFSQAVYLGRDYRSLASGTWATASTWETNATAAGPFNTTTLGGNVINATGGGITEINNGRFVTVGSTGSGNRVVISPGGTLYVSSAWNVLSNNVKASYTNASGVVDSADLIVAGTNTQGNGTLVLAAGASMIVVSNGLFSSTNQSAPITINSGATVTFRNGAKFLCSRTQVQIPTATWEVGSTVELTAIDANPTAAGLQQTFGNFIWASAAQSASRDLAGNIVGIKGDFMVKTANGQVVKNFPQDDTAVIGGNLSVTNGTVNFCSTGTAGGTLNVTGGVSVASSANLDVSVNITAPATVTLNFVGGGAHTFYKAGGIINATRYTWNVAAGNTVTYTGGSNLTVNGNSSVVNNGTLNLGSEGIVGTGSFVANSGSVTKLAGAVGLQTASATANVQTTTITSDAGASYEFNGTSAQTSGTSFPSSVKNLVINNTSGVALSSTVTVNGKLSGTGTISSGTVATTANGGVAPGNSPGTLTVASLTLDAGSTNLFEVTNSPAIGGGTNDLVIVTGVLTPNGASITVSNYGPTAIADGTDIVLFNYSGGGSIVGAFNSTPIWASAISNALGTTATIVDAGSQIKLHVAVAAAPPAGLYFQTQPSDAVAGVSVSPSVVVAATNADGSVYTNQAIVSVLKLTGNGTLSGVLTKVTDPVTGFATFTNLSIQLIGAKTLRATNTTGAIYADSSSFNITPAADAYLDLGTQPSSGQAGIAFSPQPVVNILDQFGNQTASTANVTASQNTGGTLQGTLTVAAVAGQASFTDLNATNVGTIKLNYASTGLTGTNSGNITMTAGTDARLAIGVSIAASQVDGTQFTPTPTVKILDAFNNQTASTATVTPNLNSVTGGSLAGADASGKAAVAGTATFSALHFNLVDPTTAESPVEVYYTSAGLTSVTNSTFTVNPAIQLSFIDQPTGTNAGSVLASASVTPITVLVSNTATMAPVNGATVVMTLQTGSGTVYGTTSRSSGVDGIATFDDLSLKVSGTKVLHAAALGASANSSSIWISPNAATAWQVLAPGEANAPDNGGSFKSGTPISQNRLISFSVTVNAIDSLGNIDTNITDTATITTTDASDTEPAPAALVAGSKAFTITPQSTGSDTITATGTFSANTTVNINPAPYYRSIANGSWTTSTTWEVSTNGGTSYQGAATTPSSGNSDAIQITNARIVTVGSSITVDDVLIDAGGTVQVQSAGTFNLADNTATNIDCDVFGTLQATANGSTIVATPGTLKFENGGQYLFSSTGSTMPAIPTAVWATNATCNIAATGAAVLPSLASLNQVFGNFVWNCPSQTASANCLGNLTNMQGNLEVTAGSSFTLTSSGDGSTLTFNIGGSIKTHSSGGKLAVAGGAPSGTYTFFIGGGINVDAGSTLDWGNNTANGSKALITFTGNAAYNAAGTIANPQGAKAYVVASNATLTLTSSILITNSTSVFTVTNGGTLVCGASTAVTGPGAFVLIDGGTLRIASLAGIVTSGTTGNIQTAAGRTFGTAANYIYNGGVFQVLGNALPTTVNNLTLAGGMTNYVTVANGSPNATPKYTVSGTLTADTNVIAYTVSGAALKHGTFNLYAYGTLSGTFESAAKLESGSVVATPSVTTGGGAVNLVVPNSAPTPGNDSFNRGSGISAKIAISSLLANDTDPDSDTPAFVDASATTTNGGTVSFDASFVYVPANTVNDAFTYRVHDSLGGTNTATVSMLLVSTSGQVSLVTATPTNATAVFYGIPGVSYTVQRATNVTFTLGVSNFPPITAPGDGVFTVTDDFADLGPVPGSAYYRLVIP